MNRMKKSLGELADYLDGELIGDKDIYISGVNGITDARKGDITFIANARYMKYLTTTNASAIIVSRDTSPTISPSKPLIRVDNPYLAFANVLTLMSSVEKDYFGVKEGAVVNPDARIDPEVAIYPLAYIGKNAVIGKRVVIYPGVYIGDEVTIGEESVLYPNVAVMERCVLGRRVTIHSGTVIGSDGFGFARDGKKSVKIPQVGIVKIDDDVEIGSNCSIDRAAMGVTHIKSGVIMDNLVQIGHNVVVEEDSILVAQVGISGSTHIGKNVILAGQAGLVGHIEIGDGAIITAKTGVSRNIAPGEVASGYPQMPHKKWLRAMNIVAKLPEFRKELQKLKKRVEELEEEIVNREDESG